MKGSIDFQALHRTVSPALEQTSDGLRRLRNAYLDSRGTTLLLDTLVMEGGVSRSFFVRVDRKAPDRCSVRLEPMVPVDRTRGVIGAVAWVGRLIRDRCPEAVFAVTNIDELKGGD
jgi:hypothetical protein